MNAFAAWWGRWTHPRFQTDHPLAQQHIRLLATLLLGELVIVALLMLIGWVTSPSYMVPLLPVHLGIGALCVALYSFSRTRYYRWAARLYVLVNLAAAVYAYIAIAPEGTISIFFLTVPVVMAGLVLPVPEMIAVYATTLLLTGLLTAWFPIPDFSPAYVLAYLATVGLLMIFSAAVSTYNRRQFARSERRYRQLLAANNEGILIIDPDDASILDGNPAFETITGYALDDIIGQSPMNLLTDESRSTSREYWREENHMPQELTILRQDSSTLPIEATIKPYRYHERDAFVVTVRDIRERKIAEASLRASEERFRAVFNQTLHYMGLLTPDGHVLAVNDTTLTFLDATAATVRGCYLWELPAWMNIDANREILLPFIRQAAAGDLVREQVRFRDPQGEMLTFDFSFKPIHQQERVLFVLMEGRDITEQKRAEEKRLENERRYNALVTRTTDAVFTIATDGTLIGVNEQALKMLGCSEQDILGNGLGKFVAPAERDAGYNMLERLLNGERPNVWERQMQRSDGTRFTAEISAVLVRDAQSKPLYIQSLVRDTTERRRAEQQRFELALQRERTTMLQQFIDEASHHFRTPITNIKTSIYLLPKFKHNAEKQAHYFSVLQEELQRLERLLDDLLLAAKLDQEEETYDFQALSLASLLRLTETRMQARSNYLQHNWQWQQPTPDITVQADENRLSQALLNLLDNAVRYTPTNGTISIGAFRVTNWAVLQVRDTGMGIADEDIPYIFDDFYRGNAARTQDSTSTGLGLAISQRIITMHGGVIRVDSDEGAGSTFQIILPLEQQRADETPTLPMGTLNMRETES